MPPREKILQRGIESLSNTELISAIIGTGVKGISYREIATKVLSLLKSRNSSISTKEMAEIDGVGIAKAVRLLAGIELGKRLTSADKEGKIQITDTEQASQYFNSIANKKKEYVKALYLDARFRVIKEEIITIGSHNIVNLHSRDIAIPALQVNAYGVIIGHNHPSGDPTPSIEDTNLTNRIREGCELLDIKILDHIVVAGSEWRSVRIN